MNCVLTFSSVDPSPCWLKSNPMKRIWLIIPILYLSFLRVRFLSCNRYSNVTCFLSCSSVVHSYTTMSSAMLVAPGYVISNCMSNDTVQEHSCSHQYSTSCNDTLMNHRLKMSRYPFTPPQAQFELLRWHASCRDILLRTSSLFGLGATTAGLTLLVRPKNFLVDVKVKKLVNLSLDFISFKG